MSQALPIPGPEWSTVPGQQAYARKSDRTFEWCNIGGLREGQGAIKGELYQGRKPVRNAAC